MQKMEILEYLKHNFPERYGEWINFIDNELFDLLHSILIKSPQTIKFIELNEIIDGPTGHLTKAQIQINLSNEQYIKYKTLFELHIIDLVDGFIYKKQMSRAFKLNKISNNKMDIHKVQSRLLISIENLFDFLCSLD